MNTALPKTQACFLDFVNTITLKGWNGRFSNKVTFTCFHFLHLPGQAVIALNTVHTTPPLPFVVLRHKAECLQNTGPQEGDRAK